MRTKYGKLVRDRIPDIIRAEGRSCATVTVSGPALLRLLKEKLQEEATEAAGADGPALLSELADVREVIDALSAAAGITDTDLLREQERRRQERGGFDSKTLLLWVE